MLPVTSTIAALAAFGFIALSVHVIRTRRFHKVRLLDGGVEPLKDAIRAHGNFAEYMPFCLVLMALSELAGMASWALCALGAMLLAARASHAYSVLYYELAKSSVRFRVLGMAGTFTVMACLALYLLLVSFFG